MNPMTLTRRQFAQCIVVGGVGLAFGGCGRSEPVSVLAPEWWIELHADGRILMLTGRVEMGQGAHTGLRTLLAEELDVDPVRIGIVQAPTDPRFGTLNTGGSFTVAGWHERMRSAGATARHLLLQAAAQRWRVPFAELTTFDGTVRHAASGRADPYRSFVAAAAHLSVPETVALKPPGEWRYIGQPGPVAHHAQIVAGSAQFGIDVRLPGMCVAVLIRAPVAGATLQRRDDSAARSLPGFIASIELRADPWPSRHQCRDAVAVVAEDSWTAQRARERVHVEWQRPVAPFAPPLDTLERLCEQPGIVSFERTADDDAGATRVFSAGYRQPYLAHAPLEPPNATASFAHGRLELWCGNQSQTRLKEAIVRETGLSAREVIVHSTLLGGSFGRRLEIDYGLEAAKLAVALQRPVQILWTREDDLRFGLYRSGSVHRLSARLDERNRLRSFTHRFAAESVLRQQEPEQLDARGSDWTLAAPLVALLYDIPDVRLEQHAAPPRVPCAWWRGTYWNHVTTAVECFVDELAQACGEDPLAFRLRHLPAQPREFQVNADIRISYDPARMRRLLLAVADHAGWQQPPQAGQSRGLACGLYDSPECHAVVIAEMALREGQPVLVRAIVGVDVGTAINPQIVRAQAISGFAMGASAALGEEITFGADGVEQGNFVDYPLMRMHDCPPVEVVIVPSDAGICGVGEIVTPAAMAAVSNAVSRLLRQRVRRWPVRRQVAEFQSA